MNDSDDAGHAWRVTPSEYLRRRGAPRAAPGRPRSVYVTMRDGCRIAVDVYLPGDAAAGERFAAVAIFTPYLRRFVTSEPGVEASPNIAIYRNFFVAHGYALVVVDVRGTGASFGRRDSLRSPAERDDSREIADWIVAQPWSSGVIGSTGISYLGAAACFLASTGHPAVRAIAPLFAVSDIYNEQLFPGGMLSRVWSQNYDRLMVALDQNDRALRAHYPYFSDPRLAGPQPVDDDTDGTLAAQAVQQHRDNFRLHDLMPELAFRDGAPLHAPELSTDACSPFYYLLDGMRKGLPVYSVSGWYDGGGYANGAISRFLTLAGPHDRLLLGPWDHGARINVSPWRSRPDTQFPVLAEVLRFFDEHLLGLPTGLRDERPVHYFSIHGERWHAADRWPPLPTARGFLHRDGTLQGAPAPQPGAATYQVRFDTTTGTQTRWERLGAAAVQDYYADWDGRDRLLLNFTSTVLQQDLELSGHILVDLKVAGSERDLALFVYASEIDAEGRAHYITEGMLRALHRRTADAPRHYRTSWPYRSFFRAHTQLMRPGVPQRLRFALLPVSWTLKAGSRLRLSIGGCDADHFPQVPHGRPPRIEVVVGGADGSYVEIPVRPA